MKNIKQVIVVRKDLKLKKARIAATVAHAAMQFILDNNESERPDELQVKLSQQEIHWLKSGGDKEIVGIDSHDALSDMMIRAELSGINVYSIFDKLKKSDEESQLICVALGPDEEDQIAQIIGNLKSI